MRYGHTRLQATGVHFEPPRLVFTKRGPLRATFTLTASDEAVEAAAATDGKTAVTYAIACEPSHTDCDARLFLAPAPQVPTALSLSPFIVTRMAWLLAGAKKTRFDSTSLTASRSSTKAVQHQDVCHLTRTNPSRIVLVPPPWLREKERGNVRAGSPETPNTQTLAIHELFELSAPELVTATPGETAAFIVSIQHPQDVVVTLRHTGRGLVLSPSTLTFKSAQPPAAAQPFHAAVRSVAPPVTEHRVSVLVPPDHADACTVQSPCVTTVQYALSGTHAAHFKAAGSLVTQVLAAPRLKLTAPGSGGVLFANKTAFLALHAEATPEAAKAEAAEKAEAADAWERMSSDSVRPDWVFRTGNVCVAHMGNVCVAQCSRVCALQTCVRSCCACIRTAIRIPRIVIDEVACRWDMRRHRQPPSTCDAGDDTTDAGLSCEAQPRDEAAAAASDVDNVEDAVVSTNPPAAEASQSWQPPDATTATVRVVASSNLVTVVPQVRDEHSILTRFNV